MPVHARLFLFALFCFAFPHNLSAAYEPLPPDIAAVLNQEYPGWMFAKSSPDVLKEFQRDHVNHPPYMIWGDFDQDGQRDYVVQIARTSPGDEEQIVTALLKRGSSYKEIILESRGLDPKVYLWTRKRKRTDAQSLPPDQKMQDLAIVSGGPIGDSVYAFENGSFREIETTVPPESPDPQ